MRKQPQKRIDLLAAVAQVREQQPVEMTLAELVDAHSKVACDGSDTRLRKWTDAYGAHSAWSITPDVLTRGAQAMLDLGYKPSAVNRDLSALGSAYKWVLKGRKAPPGFRSPTVDVRRFPEPIRRVHVEAAQLRVLRAVALTYPNRRFAVFVALLIETGARKGELLGRRWSEIDLDKCEVFAPITKNGTPRVLFFHPQTAELIKRLCPKRDAEEMVFPGSAPGSPISFRKAWSSATKEAGVPELHMHDVRHAAAASLLRSGVTLPVAAQVLGHDAAVLARRYGHLETSSLRRAQERAWESSAALCAATL